MPPPPTSVPHLEGEGNELRDELRDHCISDHLQEPICWLEALVPVLCQIMMPSVLGRKPLPVTVSVFPATTWSASVLSLA